MNILEVVKGLPETEKLYWQQPDARIVDAKILKIFQDGSDFYVVCDKTIFYPQGGDQLGDTGTIKGKDGELIVKKVLLLRGVVLHGGKISGGLKEGETVKEEVFWPGREKHTATHSLGHLIGGVIWQLNPQIKVVETQMTNPAWIKFEGTLNEADLKKIENIAVTAIKEKRPLTIRFVALEELKKICRHVPEKLPATNLRIVQIEGFEPIPCGGTHVKNLGKIGAVKILKIEKAEAGLKRIFFDLV